MKAAEHVKALVIRTSILLFLLWTSVHQVCTQPYVDLFQVRYNSGFRAMDDAATPFSHIWAGSDLPVKLKEKTYLVFSPTYDQWQFDSADQRQVFPVVRSLSFPVGFMTPLGSSKWSLTLFAIPRWNGEKLFTKNTFQPGGVFLMAYSIKPTQKFRAGIYVNDEFFGLYFVPLIGADWRIDEKNYLFGVLPGRLTFEYHLGNQFYTGFTFRAITNSYRFSNGQYLRLDDSQLSLFLDYYLSKNICITLEPGYGLFRQLRTGENRKEYLKEVNWGDGPFIKVSGAYRIRV